METILIITVLTLIGALYLWRPKRFKRPETRAVDPQIFKHFEAASSIFVNAAERIFFQHLHRYLVPRYTVLTKVRLEDIIRVKRTGLSEEARWRLRGRVKSRHVDFLITDMNGCPVLAIELDGPSHEHASARNADDLKTGLFEAVNIPLQRVKTGQNFDHVIADIAAKLP